MNWCIEFLTLKDEILECCLINVCEFLSFRAKNSVHQCENWPWILIYICWPDSLKVGILKLQDKMIILWNIIHPIHMIYCYLLFFISVSFYGYNHDSITY